MTIRTAHHNQAHHISLPTVSGLVSRILMAVEVSKQRRALANMDYTQLNDLGLTRKQAIAEAKRFAWDVPATWRA